MNTLLLNDVFSFQDPFFDDNLASIPDISETGPFYWTFFWVSDFQMNSTDFHENGKEFYSLDIAEINYKGTLFLNGELIRHKGKKKHKTKNKTGKVKKKWKHSRSEQKEK